MLLRVLERCEELRRRTLRAGTKAQSTVHQHVGGVCLTLSTGGPISAILILIGARRRRRCLGRWRADTTAQSTIHQHVGGVCLTLSTGGPSSAILILIGARSRWRRCLGRRRRCLGRWRRCLGRWRADAAAQTTILQHVGGVCLTLSTGGPISAILIIIGAWPWRRRRLWLWRRRATTIRSRRAVVEEPGAFGTVGHRQVAPARTIFSTIPTVCFEL